MLTADHRLRDPDGFRAASRRGRRAGTRSVVTHLLLPEEQQVAGMPVRVGFVVSKAVGNAATRNRVKRRLRHAVRAQLGALDGQAPGSLLVVRAQPAAAQASFAGLSADLDHCLQRVLTPASPEQGR